MSNLYYTEIILQDYFKTEGITTEEALNMFKWRVYMAPLGENFRNNKSFVNCPLCNEHLDNQSMVFRCRVMRSNITIKMAVEDIYRDIISLTVSQELHNITKVRKKLLDEAAKPKCTAIARAAKITCL